MYAWIVPSNPAASARLMYGKLPLKRRSRSIEKCFSDVSPSVSSYVDQGAAAAKSLESMVAFMALNRAPDFPKSSSSSSSCFGAGSRFKLIAPLSVMEAPKPPIT